ncbi:hypothetical protein QIW52_14995 [Clostridioides difficile]|nr:hypothetical protein [Clostridioides difficile]
MNNDEKEELKVELKEKKGIVKFLKKHLKIIISFLIGFILGAFLFMQKDVENNNSSEDNNSQEQTNNENTSEEQESKTVALNEKYTVSSSEGDFAITITGAKKVNWWSKMKDNNDKQIVALNYEVENINIPDEGINVDDDYFIVSDDNGYVLDNFSAWYDDQNGSPEKVAEGMKSKFTLPYIAEPDVKSVDVILFKGSDAEAKINLSLE